MAVSTEEYKKALERLKNSLSQEKNEFIRDSVIQRFEFTVELAWKSARKVLATQAQSPKMVIREMAQDGLIDDPKVWFAYLEARNLSSHSYQEAIAEQVYEVAKKAVVDFEKLLRKLDERK